MFSAGHEVSPRIAIIGAGAVGGYLAAHLVRAGRDVTVVDRWPAHLEAIRGAGLRITYTDSRDGFVTRPTALAPGDAARLSADGPLDIAFICTKSYDTDWAAGLVAPHLAAGGIAVSLQNCINEEAIAAVVGADRTLGCIASSITVELKGPGHINRTAGKTDPNYPVFRVGEIDGAPSSRVRQLRDLLAIADIATTTDNLLGERWSKLAINNMGAGLSSISGLIERDFTADARYRRFACLLGAETIRVADALGHRLIPVLGLDPAIIVAASSGEPAAIDAYEQAKRKQLANTGWGVHRPSMAQDTAKGRPTEVEFMNGFVVRKAAPLGLAAPANLAMTEMVKAIEAGSLLAAPENIAALESKVSI